MIKFITIVVLLATGLQCRVIPDDVPAPISPEERSVDKSDISPEERSVDKSDISPEERSVDKSDISPEERSVDKSDSSPEERTGGKSNTSPEERTVDKSEDRASNAASSKSAQEYSKEATVEKTGKSDTSKATAKRSAAESVSSERHERSADGNRKEGKKEETRSANIGDEKAATRASNLEKPEESSRSGECGKCTRILRNSKGNNNDAAQARSDKLEGASELKSGRIRTETAERDDASHINIEESRRAPEEGSIEAPSLRSANEEHSKTASVESENSKTASVESKSASPEPQLRSANQENERSSVDAEDDAKSALLSDVGVEELVKSDLDALTEISPGVSLRIFHQKPRLRDDMPDTAADTRMAPREDATPSPTGLQVNSFGNNDPGQSEYPYSPLGNSNVDILRMLPSLSNLFAKNLPTGNSFTPPQNINEKFPSPLDANKQFKLLPPLPPLERNEGFSPLPPLPPLEPMKPFKLLPPLRPLEIMKPFEPLPPLRPMELNGQFEQPRFLPPLDHFAPFKPLPPLRPLTMNRPFEMLPPLQPFEPIGPFKSMPPLRPLERSERNEPQPLQDPTNLIKSLQQQLQHFQHSSRNLFPTFPLQPFNTKTNSLMFTPSPNSFSVSRQALPDLSSQMSDGLSRTWHAALLTPVSAVSISRTVDFQ